MDKTNIYIAIFVSGRLYRSNNKYDFSFFRDLKKKLESENVVPIFFVSLSKECNILNITDEFCHLFDINKQDQLNIEDVEVPNDILRFPKMPHVHPEKAFKMFYHNFKCFQMIQKYSKKYNLQFNYVMKWRTDMTIYKDFDQLVETIYSLTKNNDIKSEYALYTPYQYSDWGINDQVAFGGFDAMKIYCQCVSNINFMCSSGQSFHPELLLFSHCKKNNLEIKQSFNAFYKLI